MKKMGFKQLSIWLYMTPLLLFLSVAVSGFPPTQDLIGNSESITDTSLDLEEATDDHWSSWSEWSPCSRTCDGGATYQSRRCLNTRIGCRGENIRYKICNMQPCDDPMDFRLHQCQAFDSVPYQGKLYAWVPHFEPSSPCSLYCKAINRSLIVQLSPHVHDGTRCKAGSLDMCIQGICQPVGCDLRLGSDMKIDACGVCGGDGTSCADPIYRWQYGSQLSQCSATCDGGQQEVLPVCIHTLTGGTVPSEFCLEAKRLPPKYQTCNEQPCPPVWITEPWAACSASCGGGLRRRLVYCALAKNQTRVDESLCYDNGETMPREQEPCNIFDCPRWFEGGWSECSVTCGYGLQTRPVVCRDARGHVTDTCDPVTKPETERPCFDLECPTTTTKPSTTTPPSRLPRQKVTPFNLFDDEDDVDDVDGEGREDKEERDLKKAKETIANKEIVQVPSLPLPSALLSEKFVIDERSIVPTDPTFIVGDWSPCSVTCGEGIRKREVNCKIFLEFSRTIAKLPDKECPGQKPSETEPCFKTPCSLSNKFEPWIGEISDQSNKLDNKEPKSPVRTGHDHSRNVQKTENAAPKTPHSTYTWKMSGFTQCSASCLGGVQESIIECIRDQDGQRVSPYLCPLDKRPDAITRTCNDIPCPPRWNISDFSPCSKPCGGGVQTREVHCIHEVARGGANTLPVTSDLCPQPPPRAQQYCNMIDCPVEWNIGEWTKCSATCGGGHKTRKVSCQQILALGQVIAKAPHLCIDPKPSETKPCNPRPCESTHVRIVASNQTFVQVIPKKKVTLKIGGKATVLKGTQVRIRCPVKRFDKSKIVWMKEHHVLHKSSKYDTGKKGVLHIQDVTYSDSGLYSCVAGSSSANLSLTVKPPLEDNSIATDSVEESSTNLKTFTPEETSKTKVKGKAYRPGGKKNGTRTSSKTGGKTKPDGKPRLNSAAGERWPALPDPVGNADREDESEIDTNSLDGKLGRPPFDLKQGKPRPLETWDRLPDDEDDTDFNAPLYSDQEQDWYYQTPHYTYVTRPRTTTTIAQTRPSIQPSPTAPMTTEPSYSDYEDNFAPTSPPEYIDPIPSFWPTSNWWGSIDQIRNSEEDYDNDSFNNRLQNNYIPNSHGARSGSSRPKPTSLFQLLLAGLQNNNQRKEPPIKDQAIPRVLPTKQKVKAAAPGHFAPKNTAKVNFGTSTDEATGSAVVLGKGKAENLKFEWLLTPWSKCSQTCGGTGFQVRAAQCIVRLNNVTKSVEGGLCEDAGLEAPSTMQKCGLDFCPHWETGPWTPCEDSRCFTYNTALQKREVFCRLENGTELDPILCNEHDKPSQKRECFNENCRGTWKVGEWSECMASCGSEGMQSRLLNCVWFGTDKPAGVACHDLPRPAVSQPCTGLPCPAQDQCKDSTTYCSLAATLNLCHIPRYQQRCCQTCKLGLI